jgi:hypothetical protein
MQHDDKEIIVTLEKKTEDLRAVSRHMAEIKRGIDLSGGVIVPNEVAALLAYVINLGCVSPEELQAALLALGLAQRVAYDPDVHSCDSEYILPGDPYIVYSPALIRVRDHGNKHLQPLRGRLN